MNVGKILFQPTILFILFRNMLLSVLIAVPLVTLLYVMVNVAYMVALTPEEMIKSDAVATVSKYECILRSRRNFNRKDVSFDSLEFNKLIYLSTSTFFIFF